MASRDFRRCFGLSSSKFAELARLGAFMAASSLIAAGCGSSSSSGGSAFVGRWEMDSATSSFNLNCPNTTGLMNVTGAGLWVELVFEPGVLSDITEASGTCGTGLAFKASSTGLTLVNPDPYTSQPPVCGLSLGTDMNGVSTVLAFTFDSLTFTLLSPMSGQAPKGLFAGSATGQLFQDPGTGAQMVDTCTYAGAGDIFHRMTKG
jgi:hypothetical protein